MKRLRTVRILLAGTLLFAPLYLGVHAQTNPPTSGCASLDPGYGSGDPGYDRGPVYGGGGRQDTLLGFWDRCSDGSRMNFAQEGRDLLGEIDPTRRQYDMGYRTREVVWRGEPIGTGRYQGEFKAFDRYGRARWVSCDIDVRGYEMRMCDDVTCMR